MNFVGILSLPTTPEVIYGSVIGFAILFFLLCNLTMRIVSSLLSSSALRSHVGPFILNHIIYARSNYHFLGLGSISRSRLTLTILYYVGTGICNYIGVHTIEDAGKRAARLSLVNLIPMFLGGGYEFGARLLAISLRSYGFLHRLFASVAFLEASLHVIILAQARTITLEHESQIYGVLVSINYRNLWALLNLLQAASTLLALVSLPLIKKRVYEVFHITHIACAATLVYGIWQHCRSMEGRFWAFPLAYASIFTFTGTLQLIRIIYRNVVLGRSHVRLNIQPYMGDVALMTLSLPKPWTVRAGQRIHLAVPQVGIFYVFQTHPFAISWWENDLKGRAISISILLRPRSGFTRRLFDHVKPNKGCGAWIDGPFGPSSVGWKFNGKVGNYGHVFMVTTGLGIAAQLPYIKELLDGHDNAELPTQRISLVWQLDQIGDWESGRDLLQMLIRQDNGYVGAVLPCSKFLLTHTRADASCLCIRYFAIPSTKRSSADWGQPTD